MKCLALVLSVFAISILTGCACSTCPLAQTPQSAPANSGIGRYQMAVVHAEGDHFTLVKCDSVTGEINMVEVYGSSAQGEWRKAQ